MTEVLHRLPITSRIHFKILLLVSKSQLGLAPKYLTDFMHKPHSATSARPLRSTDRLNLFVPRVRSALAQCRAFPVTGPSTWNGLPLFYRLSLCLKFLKHPLDLLSRFFSPGASKLKAPLNSLCCERRSTKI